MNGFIPLCNVYCWFNFIMLKYKRMSSPVYYRSENPCF